MSNARLEWKDPDGRSHVFPIESAEVLIGRKGDSNLVIPNQHVSRHHAKLVAGKNGHELVDLGSTYGTFINDERVSSRVLRHGDEITFGKHGAQFRFLIGEAPAPDSQPAGSIAKQFVDLSRVLPSAASDLEKMLYVLDFQFQWSQVFTPENGLEQILESALKISGAERAFIMTRVGGDFGYATGLDGAGRRLRESDFRTSRSIVREVLGTGKSVSMVEGIDKDFAAQASIVDMHIRAIACMPLIGLPTGGDAPQILGILYLDSTNAMHSLSGLDQKILNKLAVEAGNVLEHVEMMKDIEQRKTMERDLALAEETQRALLPREIPRLDHLKLHAFSRPTRYVGGDFYHFEQTESGELIGVLADVSGKGVAASLLSSMLLGCLQLLLRRGTAPAAALNELNKFLLEKAFGKFATMFVFTVGMEGAGDFINAGHNPAYLFRAGSGVVEELASNCMIVGAFDFATFETAPLRLEPGDVLLIYSDGLTEAENPAEEMFGAERLKEILVRLAPAGAESLYAAVLEAIQDFTRGQAQTDDITLIIMQRI